MQPLFFVSYHTKIRKVFTQRDTKFMRLILQQNLSVTLLLLCETLCYKPKKIRKQKAFGFFKILFN